MYRIIPALVLAFGCLLVSPRAIEAQPVEKKKEETEKKKEPTEEEKRQAEERAKAAAGVMGMSVGVFVLFCIGMLVFEMIPVIIAFARGHPNAIPILVICFFFSWTCIGWIACLAWSLTAIEPRRRPRYRDDYDD